MQVNRPPADESLAVAMIGVALTPTPIDDWLGPKSAQSRRVGKELISLGFARRIKAPRSQRHLCQKFVVATVTGRLLRERLLRAMSMDGSAGDGCH